MTTRSDATRGPSRLSATAIRALDVGLATVGLALSLPAWPALAWWARRDPTGCRLTAGAPGQRAWLWSLSSSAPVLGRLAATPLWLAVLRGRWSAVGGGAWREEQAVTWPLKPGVINLSDLRERTGIARQPRAELDAELARRWGLRAYLGLLARAALTAALPRGARPRGAQGSALGIPLVNASLDDLVRTLLRARRGLRPYWGCFVNADCLNLARRDPDYAACLRRCDAVLPDGIGVRLAASLEGAPLGENLVGTDLPPALCAASSRHGLRVFLLGGRPGVAARAAARLRAAHPGCHLVGAHDGFFARGGEEEAAVLSSIDAADVDVLLVGFGAPLQERWIAANLPRLRVGAVLGVGGLFDYYAGEVPRAPVWVRELGLEWAFRLVQEPRRLWRRYLLGNVTFLSRVLLGRLQPSRVAP